MFIPLNGPACHHDVPAKTYGLLHRSSLEEYSREARTTLGGHVVLLSMHLSKDLDRLAQVLLRRLEVAAAPEDESEVIEAMREIRILRFEQISPYCERLPMERLSLIPAARAQRQSVVCIAQRYLTPGTPPSSTLEKSTAVIVPSFLTPILRSMCCLCM